MKIGDLEIEGLNRPIIGPFEAEFLYLSSLYYNISREVESIYQIGRAFRPSPK